MIIVTGSARVREDAVAEALRLSLEHVHRSRAEPGCLEHGVYQDAEDPLRVFFFERWQDRAALDAHFAVPESGEFVTALSALTSESPTIDIHDVA